MGYNYIGSTRMTANGTISPLGVTRVYSIQFMSSVSANNLMVYNGPNSSTGLLTLRIATQDFGSQGNAWWDCHDGVLFDKGVYINTAAGSCVVVIGYQTEE